MSKTSEIERCSIHSIFDSPTVITYQIPIYQRNYAWGKDEIAALVSDILDAQQAGRDVYYIGTLVTFDRGEQTFEVIDGQQRLTTLFLILKALGVSFHNTLAYRARKEANNTLKKLFQPADKKGEVSCGSSYKSVQALLQELGTEVDLGLVNGFRNVQAVFDELGIDASKTAFITYLTEQVYIIHYKVPKDIDLNHYFEVMNSRGEQLEKHEIVKAKLIDLLPSHARNCFAEIWQACSEMNVYIQQSSPYADYFFGEKRHDFKFFYGNFDALEACIPRDSALSSAGSSDGAGVMSHNTIETFLNEKAFAAQSVAVEAERESFRPIIDFPNFLLIVLKLTCLETRCCGMEDIPLDDKELINAFKRVPQTVDFVKCFGFNLLKAKYLLDNYIVHHTQEDDLPDSNPWQLEHWQKEGKEYSKNLSDDSKLQRKLVHLLSMFEVSFTPRQRKNYLLYTLLHLFSDRNLEHYATFLSQLSDKYFFDIYLNGEVLNIKNTPNPNAFDSEVLADGHLNVVLRHATPDYPLVFGGGNGRSRGVPLFVFNYMDYRLWCAYAEQVEGKQLKDNNDLRRQFFEQLGCKDFGLEAFNRFYFSRTRRSLEHFYPQANTNEGVTDNQINCFGNYAMMGADMNSAGSNWSPAVKVGRYLDASHKIAPVSVASLKLMVMLQQCKDNRDNPERGDERAWLPCDMEAHQAKMQAFLQRHYATITPQSV